MGKGHNITFITPFPRLESAGASPPPRSNGGGGAGPNVFYVFWVYWCVVLVLLVFRVEGLRGFVQIRGCRPSKLEMLEKLKC